jgi:hypothetical protein
MNHRKTGRLDANESALFLRSAEHIMAQTYDVEYPENRALMYIPVNSEAGPGAEVITYRQFDSVGMALVVNSYAKDFPRVDVRGKEFSQKVHSLGNSYGYNVQEIRRADMEGVPLDAMRGASAKEAHMQKQNRIAMFGDNDTGMKGLIYHPNVTKSAAVTGTWSSASSDQILGDVQELINAVRVLTKDVEYIDTVLLPLASYSKLATKPYSTTVPTFLLTILKEGNPGVSFYGMHELGALAVNPRTGGAGPVNAMIGYRRDPRKLFLATPVPFEQFAPQAENMDWTIPCHSRFAGLIVPKPLSIHVVDGI